MQMQVSMVPTGPPQHGKKGFTVAGAFTSQWQIQVSYVQIVLSCHQKAQTIILYLLLITIVSVLAPLCTIT